MLHGIGKKDIPKIKEFNLLKKAEELKEKGKIKHFGFSFHDNFEALKELLSIYDKWEFCQIQYNYLDEYNQATTEGLKLLHEKGIYVIIMEPLRGGALSNVPENVRQTLDSVDKERSSTNWALSWLFDKKEISIILSGMSSMEQLKENIEIANNANIDCFSDKMRETVKNAYAEYEKRIKVGCTDCKYCMPCPKGVDIPFNFRLLNNDYKLTLDPKNNWQYNQEQNKEKNASNCIGCKACEPKCPQKIKVSDELKAMSAIYAR